MKLGFPSLRELWISIILAVEPRRWIMPGNHQTLALGPARAIFLIWICQLYRVALVRGRAEKLTVANFHSDKADKQA